MGIVNVTPDSFADGGRFFELSRALAHARELIDEGADILDIGGESTRPGAAGGRRIEEIRRVVPVLEALAGSVIPLSVDTSKPEVMRAALAAGAAIVNDVCALQAPGALEAVAESDCGVVLMHMQGSPRTMQQALTIDVVAKCATSCASGCSPHSARGVAAAADRVDPGFGFGKTVEHNFTLLSDSCRHWPCRCADRRGLSRKGMLGAVSGRAVDDRTAASVAATVLAVERGAHIVRVHDVAATRDALRVGPQHERESHDAQVFRH